MLLSVHLRGGRALFLNGSSFHSPNKKDQVPFLTVKSHTLFQDLNHPDISHIQIRSKIINIQRSGTLQWHKAIGTAGVPFQGATNGMNMRN